MYYVLHFKSISQYLLGGQGVRFRVVNGAGFCTFGQHLSKLRKEKGWSQVYLGNVAGIERSQIVRIENGEINTTLSTIYVLAEALEVDKKIMLDF